MTDKVIEYKSGEQRVNEQTDILERIDRDGIVCGKIAHVDYIGYETRFYRSFDWNKLKNQGVERITGYIIIKEIEVQSSFGEHKIDIDFEETTKIVTKEIPFYPFFNATFEYRLTLYYDTKIKHLKIDEMFAASEMNDTVLVIEGKKVHVNKVFFSYHSEFFRALFSSNFKEGQLTEIPIKDVTYEDFGLLMSIIYPRVAFPNDQTAEKLLELADRFLLPHVTGCVEHHLLELSRLSNEKLMWMADAYGLKNLLEKCVRSMDTVEKVKKLQASPEYEKMSNDSKVKLFDRIFRVL